jgi:AAA ATPase domain
MAASQVDDDDRRRRDLGPPDSTSADAHRITCRRDRGDGRSTRLDGLHAMRLYSVTLQGYKRFANAWMNLDGKVVAIVGPNEAGKSSILDALLLLNDDQAVPTTALTRGESYGAGHEVAWARFRLSAEERALAPLPLAADEGVWLMVAKTVAGPRHFRLDPPATRDRSARRDAAAAIKAASRLTWFKGVTCPKATTPPRTRSRLQSSWPPNS